MGRGFASDNQAGAHPNVLAALTACNEGHVPAYGDDGITARAAAAVAEAVGGEPSVFFALTGTGANVIALRALVRPWEAIACAATAHIANDEAGAPEFQTGAKIVTIPTEHGKLTPADVTPLLAAPPSEHHPAPRVVSITQATEYGTVYTPAEVAELAAAVHKHGGLLHMDGARLANAVASLGVHAAEVTSAAGVDALSLGFTKAGAVGCEAVVLFRPELAAGFRNLRKQSGQLASKQRFVAVQAEALLASNLWVDLAASANGCAARLAAGAADIPGVQITHPVEANEVFARVPTMAVPALQAAYPFYVWDGELDDAGRVEVRWVCSWDTTREDVDGMLALLASTLGG
jgi:threonine aldolase